MGQLQFTCLQISAVFFENVSAAVPQKAIQVHQRRMNSSPFKTAKQTKNTSNGQQKLQKRCSFELLECCSHCKRSNFKAIVLYTGILCTSNQVCCMGFWVRRVSVHLYNSRGLADNVSVKIKNSFSQIFLSHEDLKNYFPTLGGSVFAASYNRTF